MGFLQFKDQRLLYQSPAVLKDLYFKCYHFYSFRPSKAPALFSIRLYCCQKLLSQKATVVTAQFNTFLSTYPSESLQNALQQQQDNGVFHCHATPVLPVRPTVSVGTYISRGTKTVAQCRREWQAAMKSVTRQHRKKRGRGEGMLEIVGEKNE